MTPSLHTVTSGVEGGLSFIFYLFTYELPDFISFLIKELLVSIMKSIFAFFVALLAIAGHTQSSSTVAFGSYPDSSRALMLEQRQFRISSEGEIYICREIEARPKTTFSEGSCGPNDDKWIPMINYVVPGYHLTSFSFMINGARGNPEIRLILYFGKTYIRVKQ